MTHIDEGTLRAYLDNELSSRDRERVAHHLTECSSCTRDARTLAGRAAWAAQHLTVPDEDAVPAAHEARARLASRRTLEQIPPTIHLEETSMTPTPFWRRLPTPALVGVAAALLIVLTLTISPIRTFAADFLQIFRVEHVTVLPVDIDDMDTARFEGMAQQAQLIASVLEVEPIGESQEVADAAAASAIVGRPVRLPAGVDALHVEAGASMRGTIDEAQLEAVFAALDQPIDLPSAVDGKPFEITVPQMVRAELGEGCERPHHRGNSDCIMFVQVESPVIEFPDEMPVQQMGELFLQLVGYAGPEAREIARSIDWTSTLVVPVPRRAVESRTLTVDGVEGTLLMPDPEAEYASEGYALIWVREGTLYGLAGTGDPATGIQLANTLR